MSLNGIPDPLHSRVDGWLQVCAVDDLPLFEGRNVTVDGALIAIFRTADGYFALDGVCPHKGGPLADGILADGCVTCPLHARRFDLRTGELINGDDEGVQTYEVAERDGMLWLALDSPARAA